MTLTKITSKSIKDNEIVNADLHSAAAIAGTKIAPDFGSQDPTTTGKFITNSSSSGDYIRLYAGSGTGKWDIYGNGANLRIGDNDSAGAVTIDTKVGIGTTSPSRNLHVVASENNDAASIINNDTTDGYGLNVQGGGSASGRYILRLAEAGGTERLRVTSTGNVGIGTTSPDQLFTVKGLSKFEATNSTNGWVKYTHTDNTFRVNYNGAGNDEIVITSDGKVGIGTASPSQNLEVVTSSGDPKVLISGPGHAQLNLVSTGNTDHCGVNFGDSDDASIARIQYTNSNNSMQFHTNGSERMRIDSSGHVLIGTTSSNARLHVEENAALSESDPHVEVRGSGYALYMFLDSNAAHIGQNSAHRDLKIYSGSSTTSGAQLTAGATSFTTYSDERLKTDIKDIGSVLDKISDIRCVSYIRKDIENFKETIGFVAQDFVNKFDQVLDSTKIKESDTEEHLGIKYTETIPILLKAIQELSAKVAALEAA